jgi:hypothetical protein
LQNLKGQGLVTDENIARMQDLQGELKGTDIIEDSGELAQFY